MNIILTGFMGSGKTTVGRRLAARLGWRFADLDRLVERGAGTSVGEIFRRRGEVAFRRLEHRAIRSLARRRSTVVAAGGGAPAYPPNRRWLRAAGLRVWMRVPVATLARRLTHGGGRPLLAAAGSDPAALRRLIGRLLRLRRASYATADVTVEAGRGSPGAVAGRILRAVRRRAGGTRGRVPAP